MQMSAVVKSFQPVFRMMLDFQQENPGLLFCAGMWFGIGGGVFNHAIDDCNKDLDLFRTKTVEFAWDPPKTIFLVPFTKGFVVTYTFIQFPVLIPTFCVAYSGLTVYRWLK